MLKKIAILLSQTLLLASCATLQNKAKYDLADGKYKLRIEGKKFDCYIENNADSIEIYNFSSKISTNLPENMPINLPIKQQLVKSSLDIDILTALFKLRPPAKNILPAQINTNFNGNIYLGHRTDVYQIHYKKNPLGIYQRQINHFGFSGGIFAGLANTAMNPSTTNNKISTEYDGIILQKGIAGIMAVNKLTIGLSLGFDDILGKENTWIYQNKPWFGLMLGLNLN